MRTTVEPLEGNKVKLSVEVDEAEFDRAIDAAFRKIAKEVRLPGFRPGKAPRKVLEARIGLGPAREQALRDAIPVYLADAVRQHDVDIIATPDIDITAGHESGPVAFDATVEVRPQIIVPGYGGLRVELPNPRPTDADVDAQIDRMRQPFAQTSEVDRPAADGDVVTIDIVGRRDDADEPFIERSDYLYEVGQPDVVEELAEHVRGRSAGDEFGFSVDHADHDHPPLHFEVRVKKVQEKVLPPADDVWAREVSEFDTLAELRADLFARLHRVRAAQARMALRERTSEALGQLVDEEPPESLVQGEMRRRLEDLAMRLSAQGLQIEQYLMATGQDPQAFTDELRRVATESVKIDLALRAVAQAEGLECDDDELDAEYARIAAANNVKPSEVRKAYERNDAVTALRSEIRKRKALEWLVEHAEVVDPDGQPISPADLSPETSSDAAPAAEEVSE